MPTIYRQYRPQTFADVTGQNHIILTLKNEIATGKIAHAYLFSGPRGVGKTTTARLFAKAVNCYNRQGDDAEPCNQCASCQEIAAGRNIDVIEIDAASHRQVEDIQENIIEKVQFKPTRSKYKIFIIDEVHMLTTHAFNAVLKTIEEPPAHVVFILATTDPHKLPATVVSRCQRFHFQKIGYDDMAARLTEICKQEKIKVDKKVIDRIVNKSDGCLRDAESLLGQILSLNLETIEPKDALLILPTSDAALTLNFAAYLIRRQAADGLKLLGTLAADGVNLEQFAYDLLEILRHIMIIQTNPAGVETWDYDEDTVKEIRRLSKEIDGHGLIKLLDAVLRRRAEIKNSPLPQLPLELLAVEFGDETASSETKEETNPPAPETPKKSAIKTDAPKTDAAAHHSLSDSLKSVMSTITGGKRDVKSSLADIQAKWPEFIAKISETNHSLTFILKMCNLKGISGEQLLIAVPYALHRDKLEEKKTKRLLEDQLAAVLNEKIHFTCMVEENGTITNSPIKEDINILATEFGGEVVTE